MITPWRVAMIAAVLGIGAAILVSMQKPPPPPEEALTEAAPPPPPAPLGPPAPTSQPTAAPMQLAAGEQHMSPTGLTIVEIKEGTGPAAKSGDTVMVHYIGRLYNGGVKFDSSYDHNSPLQVKLGAQQVIPGFDEGVTGMKVGGKRQVLIPPNLGYGAQGAGGVIPPNATLVFDLELMSIQ